MSYTAAELAAREADLVRIAGRNARIRADAYAGAQRHHVIPKELFKGDGLVARYLRVMQVRRNFSLNSMTSNGLAVAGTSSLAETVGVALHDNNHNAYTAGVKNALEFEIKAAGLEALLNDDDLYEDLVMGVVPAGIPPATLKSLDSGAAHKAVIDFERIALTFRPELEGMTQAQAIDASKMMSFLKVNDPYLVKLAAKMGTSADALLAQTSANSFATLGPNQKKAVTALENLLGEAPEFGLSDLSKVKHNGKLLLSEEGGLTHTKLARLKALQAFLQGADLLAFVADPVGYLRDHAIEEILKKGATKAFGLTTKAAESFAGVAVVVFEEAAMWRAVSTGAYAFQDHPAGDSAFNPYSYAGEVAQGRERTLQAQVTLNDGSQATFPLNAIAMTADEIAAKEATFFVTSQKTQSISVRNAFFGDDIVRTESGGIYVRNNENVGYVYGQDFDDPAKIVARARIKIKNDSVFYEIKDGPAADMTVKFGLNDPGLPEDLQDVINDLVLGVSHVGDGASLEKFLALDREALERLNEAGDAAKQFGAILTTLLQIENPYQQLAASVVIDTVFENIGELIEARGANVQLPSGFTSNVLSDFFSELGFNAFDAGVGLVSSYLAAEIIDALGMEGTVAGDLATSAGAQAIGTIIHNIPSAVANGASPFAGVTDINPWAIVSNYVGGKLADEIWSPQSAYGQIGSAIGSIEGAIIASKIIAFMGPANPLGYVAAAAAYMWSKLRWGFIGSLFGASKSYAEVRWDGASAEFGTVEVHSKRGGSKSAARSLADATASVLNSTLGATGGQLINSGAVFGGVYGLRNQNYVYWSSSPLIKSKTPADIINHGVYVGLSGLIGQLGGGNVYAKRAIAANLSHAGGSGDPNVPLPVGAFDYQALLGDLMIAADYLKYTADPVIINNMIVTEPKSAVAAGWILTLARADELNLGKRSFTDWIGGWNLFLDEAPDSVIDGIALRPSNLQLEISEYGGREFVIYGEDSEVVAVIADTVSSTDKAVITFDDEDDVDNNDYVVIDNDTLVLSARARINGGMADGSAFKIPVAALIDLGAGDDIARAGDLGNDTYGDIGNDKIVGGKLDDWLFGEDGDDVLFAGDVVAAGVVPATGTTANALTQTNATFTVNAASATAVDGGNGDLLDGGEGNDRLYGGKGSEWLRGGDGVDQLYGGAGGDILEGGAGDDQGAAGAAAIFGGAGSDQYVFGYGDGNDVIFDESDPAGVAGATGDTLYNRIAQINAGTLARNWAGGGSYEVDGSVKGGEDAVVFGVGVTMQNLIMKRSGTTAAPGQDLIIQLTADDPNGTPDAYGKLPQIATGDTLTIKDWFESTRKVEWLRFANGDEIRIADITSYVIGVAGSSVILGTNGADWIVGTDGNDNIRGLNGDDFGFGGLGNDMVAGDANNDLVSGGSGEDVVIGGAGNDTALGDGGNDRVSGGAGNDLLAGGKGDDTIIAGAGIDTIRYARGDGRDILLDDLVNNWDLVWQNGAYVNGYTQGADGTISKAGVVYFDGAKWIDGFNYEYDDTAKTLKRHMGAVSGVISANSGVDTLEFAVGIDIQDLAMRRVGNDLEVVIADENTTSGFAGAADKITIRDWWSASTGSELKPIEKFSFAATGVALMSNYNIAAGATDGADTLTGTASGDWITGGGGDDVLDGGADGNDVLQGGAGADRLKGNSGGDVLYGGSGDDILDGGSSSDQLFGGDGLDIASYASNGTTGVRAYMGASFANGGSAIGDVYSGVEGIEGSQGADRLAGDANDNVIRGGLASDRLWGGAGSDTYEFNRGDGADSIYDGTLVLEEILDTAGNLNAAFASTWQMMRYGTATGVTGNYYQYQLTVRRIADNEVVYQSRDGVDFLYATTQSAIPGGSAWPYANNQWKTGAGRSNGVQVVLERIVAGDGGSDSVAMGSGISLSDLTATRGSNFLKISVDASSSVTLYDQVIAERAVETVQLSDGLVADLTRLRLGAEAATTDVDFMLGGTGNDNLSALAGDDVLSGGLGTDSLSGGVGNDILEGGAGADTLDGGSDSITEGVAINASDPTSYGDTIRYVTSTAAVVIDLAARTTSGGDAQGDVIVSAGSVSTIENVVGSEGFGDTLSGDARANRLFGLGGNDTIDGRAGDDVVVGAAGSDTLYGGDGNDAVAGEDGVDRLEGGLGNDLLSGGAENDTLLGQAGDDQLSGDDGSDTLSGGDGKDVLGGADGDDILNGDAGNDQLVGGEGIDQLFAGDGDDTLIGGAGNDQLEGGAGNDTYGFDANSGVDRIVDAAGVNRIAINGVAKDQIWLTRSGDDLKIAVIGGSSVITVAGYYASTNTGRIREIALDGASLFLGHAGALVTAMTSASASPPASMPAAIASQAAPFWHAGGKAAPVVLNQTLTTNEDTVISGQVSAVDDDDNITAYAVVSAPTLGALNLNTNTGAWTYTPTGNANGAEQFVLSVADSDGQVVQQTVAITLTPVNDAPGSLTAPAVLKVGENSSNGTAVGQFSSTDPDGPTAKYVLINDAGGRFEITSTGQLKVKNGAALNYEAATSHVVRVGVSDNADGLLEKDFTVTISDIPEAPVVPDKTSQLITMAPENASLGGSTIATFSLTDPDNTTPTLRITSDPKGWLQIVGNAVQFKAGLVLDFETLAAGATLVDTDNDSIKEFVYNFTVDAWDGTLASSSQVTLSVKIEDVNEAPTNIAFTPSVSSVAERDRPASGAGSPAISLGVLSATDPDTTVGSSFATLSYSVADSLFEIVNGNELRLKAGAALNYEAGATHSMSITVKDLGGAVGALSFSKAFNLTVTNQDDFLDGDASANALLGQANRDLLYGYGGGDSLSGGTGDDDLYGGDGDDILNGDAGVDVLDGGLGNDTLNGGAGIDTLRGGDGADTLSGGSENDNLYGDAGNDGLDGGANDDLLDGGDGNDQLTGAAGIDRLVGGLGDDFLDGGAGADRFLGGAGTDTVSYASAPAGVGVIVNLATGGTAGDAAGDIYEDVLERLVGSPSDDSLTGTIAGDFIQGGSGNDTLVGNDGVDNLDGGAGDDILRGGNGNDTLIGGVGSDTMYGGAGDDVYLIDINSGADYIDAFDSSGGKDSIGYQADANGQNPIENSQLWFERPVGTTNLVISVVGTGVSSTVLKWYDTSTGGNQKINFIIAGAKYTVDAEGLVTLMAAQTKPTTAAAYQALHGNASFENQWRNLWFQNSTPTLGAVPKQTIDEDITGNFEIAVSDDITSLDNLILKAMPVNVDANEIGDIRFINSISMTKNASSGKVYLSYTTHSNVSGKAAIKITAEDPGKNIGSLVVNVDILPRADTPEVTQARPLAVTLATGVLALDVQAALIDQDGSETLKILIGNVPTGLSLNKGTNLGGGVWSLTQAELSGLALLGPIDWSKDLVGPAALNVGAISAEPGSGDTATYGPADNQIANSRFLNGQSNWQITTNKAAGMTGWGNNLDTNWSGSGNDVLYSTMYGAQTAGSLIDIRSDMMPTKAGNLYETSVMAAQHRGVAELWIEYYRANGTLISAIKLPGSARESGALYGLPENFERLGGVTTAPAEAVGRRVNLRLASTTGSDPYAFFMRPISRPTTQAALGDWSRFYPKVLNVPINARPTNISSSAVLTIAENTAEIPIPADKRDIATLTGADPDADTLTYTLVDGGDGWGVGANGRFKIGKNNGILSVDNANSVNFESGGSVKVWVEVSDASLTYKKDFTVNITNVYERPTIPAANQSTWIFSEGVSADALIATYSATDPDAVNNPALNPGFAEQFDAWDYLYMSGGQLRLRPGKALDFEWLKSLGADSWRQINVDIDGDGRQEVGLAVDVIATDATVTNGTLNSASARIWYYIEDVNEGPTDLWADRTLSVAENSTIGTVVGIFHRADQDAADGAAYSLLNNASPFAFSGSTLVVAGALNYESTTSYDLTVRVTDPYGAFYDEPFSVAVANVNEKPTVGGATLAVSELAASGTFLGSISYGDPDAAGSVDADLRFELSGTGFEKFSINNAGQIFYQSGSIDYEAQPRTYNLTVVARDRAGGGLTSSVAALTINVGDANEAPTVSGGTMSINELAGPGSYVGAVSYSDPDAAGSSNANLQFSLSGTGSEKFSINGAGQIFYQTGLLDYETQPRAYNLTVTARDQAGNGLLSPGAAVTINIDNVNEAPIINSATVDLHGNAAYRPPNESATYITYHDLVFAASDPEGSAVSFSIASVTNYSGSLYPQIIGLGYNNVSIPILKVGPQPNGPYAPPQYFSAYTLTLRASDGSGYADYTYNVNPGAIERIAPIILDLDGDGISLTPLLGSTVSFDQDGDGVLDRTGWVGPGDGLLVLDRNGNGVIDDGSELRFSTDEEHAASDLEGLRVYDSNANGLFDATDDQFAAFQIWRDVNQNGVSEDGELFSLAELDITAINLTLTLNPTSEDPDMDENLLYGTTQFVRADGSIGAVGDVMLAFQSSITASVTLVDNLGPVVIDLDGDGIELVARTNSKVRFDIAGDGNAVRTGWVGAHDAFLALDRNGDGKITNGGEISFVGDLEGAISDLEGLRAFDSNENGFLDGGDARFNEFLVWQDKNQDGTSQADELRSLSALGLKSLNLTQTMTGASTAVTGENVLYATSNAYAENGSRFAIGDVMLAYDAATSLYTTGDVKGAAEKEPSFDTLGAEMSPRDILKTRLDEFNGPRQRQLDGLIESEGFDRLGQKADAAPESQGLSSIDRVAASTLKPPSSTLAPVKPASAFKPKASPVAADKLAMIGEAEAIDLLAPRSARELGLSDLLAGDFSAAGDWARTDYGDTGLGRSNSALDAGLALSQQNRLQMIQAMAGFSREGAADFGPDAMRRGHAQSLALLTALPDIRVR